MGVAGCALLAALTFLINLGFTLFAISYGIDWLVLVYQGSCRKTESLILVSHIGVNLLSSALLAASNYCMQVLSSPTRPEIDKAHSEKAWMDIGLQSARNLRRIAPRRAKMWWLLVVSSIPLHLLYNSAAVTMLSAYEYRVLFVTPEILPGAGKDTPIPLTPDITKVYELLRDNPQSFEMLTQAECYEIYSRPFVTNRNDVIVILNSTEYEVQLQLNISIIPTINYSTPTSPIKISRSFIQDKLEEAHQRPLLFDSQVEIEGCLSKKAKEGCRLWISSPIFIVVTVCNLFKAAVMVTMFRRRNQQVTPLVTMGDAIGSFLERPDLTTKGMCLVDKELIDTVWGAEKTPQIYYPRHRLWFNACSLRRWILCNVLYVLHPHCRVFASSHLTSCGVALGISGAILSAVAHGHATTRPLKLGFNSISEASIIDLGTTGKSTASAVLNVLLVNLPQVLFSMIYLFYNSIFTSMLGAYEWSRFATHRKTLRVTSPVGDQRSTYYLQMPLKYGLSFLLCSFIFHWLISQGFYYTRIAVYDLNEDYTPAKDISTTGYSPKALFIILTVGSFLLVVFGIGTGFRHFPAGLPVAGGCSAVISAACHSIDEDEDSVLRPLQWGVVFEPLPSERPDVIMPVEREVFWNNRDRPGHCSFSSRRISRLISGNYYADMPS